MMRDEDCFRGLIVVGLLVIPILWMLGCGPTPEPQTIVQTVEGEKTVVETVIETVEVEKTVVEEVEMVELPPQPQDLGADEAWQPYKTARPPVGDAKLVPGDEAMRLAVAAISMNENLMKMLDGFKINTARTVVLTEIVDRSQPASLDSGAVLASSVEQVLDGPGAWHVAYVVYDSGQWRREASWPRQLAYAAAQECPGAASNTYVTGEDNEDNAHTGSPDGDMGSAPPCIYRVDTSHPIEFRIDVPSSPPGFSEAWLSLIAWDVDEQDSVCPEQDEVYFNGHPVGYYLTGANDSFSTSGPYAIDPSWVQVGLNLVEIQVNTTGCLSADGSEAWCVGIQQGTLQLGGGGGAAYRRLFYTSPEYWTPGSIAYVEVEVDTTLDSQEVEAEINVIDAQNNVLVGASQTKVIYGTEDDPFAFDLSIPADAAPGDYMVQVFLYDTCSWTPQGSSGEYAVEIREPTDQIQETVSLAPVVADDPEAFNQDTIKQMLYDEGIVLGTLVLETNYPESELPPGTYLERARFNQAGEGIVEFISSETGELVYEMPIVADTLEDPSSDIPSAAIYQGTKWCIFRLDGWGFCHSCYWWQTPVAMTYEQCRALLP